MTTARFDAEIMTEVSKTRAPASDAGNRPPTIEFTLHHPDVMTAEPAGARIRCEVEGPRKSRVTIRTTTRGGLGHVLPSHIADVAVFATGDDDLTTETIAIASAIYWSWWRALDMHGEAPR